MAPKVESKFDPERCLQQIGQYGVTTMFAVAANPGCAGVGER
jgi:hypothetical protein